MDEQLKIESSKKEIIAIIIALLVFLGGIIVFAFIVFDLMYLIIHSAMFILCSIFLILNIKKRREMLKMVEYYTSDEFVPSSALDVLKKDYYLNTLDEIIEELKDLTCYSTLADDIVTLEIEKKDYILYIQINKEQLTYAISALDDTFYTNIASLREKTDLEEFKEEYFAKLDAEEEITINSANKEVVYTILKEFINRKVNEANHLFEVYNNNLNLID